MVEIINIQKIGAGVLNAAAYARGSFGMFRSALRGMPALAHGPVRKVLYKQVFFTGVEAMSKIALLGALIGMVITTQVVNIVGLKAVVTGRILVWIVVRELGPLFAAIIIIARSSTAVAAELGSMKVHKEDENLRIMGIKPVEYLIVPRIAGITLSVFVLTFYFEVSAVLGGLALSSVFLDVPFFEHMKAIFSVLLPWEAALSLFKSLVFGLVISTVACFQGSRVKGSITEIPQVTSATVMQGLFLVLISDSVITFLSFI